MLLCPKCLPAAQFGDLPSGHISRQALDGVRAEIATSVFIDSTVAARFVPAGLRLVTLQQAATGDTALARYLVSRPHLRSAVRSNLAFVARDSLRIGDGAPIQIVSAFWWLPVHEAPFELRARGESWVEVGYWSADSNLVRLEQAGRPHLQSAPVTMEQAADGEWDLSLTLPDAVIRGRCRPSGVRQAATYPLPAYSTVWGTGTAPVTFELFTYR